jgi:hypothetical protein
MSLEKASCSSDARRGCESSGRPNDSHFIFSSDHGQEIICLLIFQQRLWWYWTVLGLFFIYEIL